MTSINSSRITTAAYTTLISLLFMPSTIAFAPTNNPLVQLQQSQQSQQLPFHAPPHSSRIPTTSSSPLQPLHMSLADVSDFYALYPLQAAVLTCGVKAHVADGIAQVRTSSQQKSNNSWIDDIEFRRNLAYIIYGGIFIGALCHYEYDVIFPILFGTQHSLWTSFQEVIFDNFVTAPLAWLPPAYIIKALMYDYPMMEGLQKYVNDVRYNGLLQKYWTVWVPAQSISFTVVPDHLRVVFMASVSFFWFILFSTVSSKGDDGSGSD